MDSTFEKLYALYSEAKKQENSLDYINELLEQIDLFAHESNSLTKDHIEARLKQIIGYK